MARPTTPLLSREKVFAAALAVVDATGSFSLPRLAAELGVTTSSLYHHVPGGRTEIVEGVRALVSRPFAVLHADDDEHWRHFAARWARAYRASMAEHPRVVPLLAAQTVASPEVLAGYEALAAALERAGATGPAVVHLITVLDCLVLGSALDAGAPVEVWADGGEAAPALRRSLRAADEAHGQDGADRSTASFELGLAALLSGLGTVLGLPG